MAMGSLVLNKSALSGLRLLFWHEATFKDGTIQLYDEEHDCFIVGLNEQGITQHAVQFHQFMVEEEQGQLQLKVTKCTVAAVPDKYRAIVSPATSVYSSARASDRASDAGTQQTDLRPADGSIWAPAAEALQLTGQQLSAELSQQLSGLVGQSFSQTDEGFQALLPEKSAPIALPPAAAGSHQAHGTDADQEALGEDADEAGSFWGSPVKATTSVLLAAAAADSSTGSTSMQLGGDEAAPAAAMHGSGAGLARRASCSSSSSSDVSDTQLFYLAPGEADASTTGPPAAASKPSSCFSSFQEISRMISQMEDAGAGSAGDSRHGGRAIHQLGVAARLLEEPVTWGTPREGSSSWGSPRERRSAAAAASGAAAAADEHDEPVDASLPSFSVQLAAIAAGEEHGDGPQDDAGAASSWPAAAHAEVPASAGASDTDLDFTIPVGVADAPPRPASRAGSMASIRERLQDGPLDATDEGMMVDIPQPLSSRRVSRTSARHLYMPSDPGFGPAGPAGGSSLSSHTELRRTVSNMSAPASRRISRNTSSRINADQDWAITGPDGQLLPQHMQQHTYASTFASAAGTAVAPHVPGPASRRASRTLSGRLLDQDGIAVLLDQLDDAEPDVPRPATSMALDTIVSRHQSNSGRDTPDSDELGFGFSEVIGEPLVPPELAQHAALAEAAQQTATTQLAEAAATGGPLAHSRSHRRSHRSIPAAAPVPQQRVSMRLSDQDDHQGELAAAGMVHSSSPAMRQSVSSSRLAAQVIEEASSFNPEHEEAQESQQRELDLQQQQQQQQQHLLSPEEQPQQLEAAPLVAEGGLQRPSTCSPSSTEPSVPCSAAGTAAGTATPAAATAGSCSEAGTRSSSRRSMSGILQAAAAVAAVAEAAAATAVGFALGGKGTPAEQQALEAAAAEAEAAEAASAAGAGDAQTAQPAANYSSFAAGVGEKAGRQLMQDSFVGADSFNCPAFMPLLGSGSAKNSLNPFADSSFFSFSNNQFNSSSSIPAFIGTLPVEAAEAVPQAPAGLSNPGSPNAATTALLRKQQLLPPAASGEGSEWGSGALLGVHLMSGIDSPTGGAVFKSNPFDGADSGDLNSLEPTLSAGLFAGVASKLGASRMRREAASVLPFASLGASGGIIGSKASITEITPADDDSDDEKIGSYSNDPGLLRSSTGGTTAAAAQNAADFCRLPAHGAVIEQAAVIEPGAAEPVRLGATRSKGSTDAGSSGWAAPPSYAESVSAEADDECSLSAELAGVRRVWPAQYAAASDSSDGSGGGSNQGAVRHGAELVSAASGAMGQQLGSTPGRCSSLQLDASSRAAEAAAPGATGLMKRNVSRTPSQALPAGLSPMDGIVLLSNGGGYAYEDEDVQPLVMQQQRGAMGHAAGQVPRTLQEARTQVGRAALDTLLANSAHFFDSLGFVVLGGQLMAAMASPAWSQQQHLGALFALFAAGHVLWLLGCLLWSWVTARHGRRTALTWMVCLSAFPTALLGCMPSFEEGGVAGLAVIAVLRFLSGLGLGNEAPSSLVYLTEHAPQFPCLHASLVPCAMAGGAFGASAVALFFSWVLSSARLGVLGWRLVLVASLLVNALNVVLRGFVLQDPEAHMSAAEYTDRRNTHLWKVIRHHPGRLLAAFGLQAFAATGLFLVTAWMPVFYMQLTALPASLALAVHTVNAAVLTASIPLGGFLADKYGRSPLLLSTVAAAALFGYPAWLLFQMSVPALSWFCQFMLVVFVGLHWGGLATALVEAFPKGVRASALTLAFVLPMALLGSAAPLMALGLVMSTGSLASPAIITIITSVVTGATVLATQL